MIERRSITGYDFLVFLLILIVLSLGVLSIYSVTQGYSVSKVKTPLYMKQIYWICLGLLAFVVMAWIDYHQIVRWAYPIYAITVILLILVLLMGPVIHGARRWLSFGLFTFQPSEVAKIALLLALAKYFSDDVPKGGLSLSQIIPPSFLLLLPLLLVLKQPDLGTALSISSIFIVMIFVLGFRSRFLIYTGLLSAMLFPFLWQFFWGHLKDYQKERLLTFINPASDPMGTGYHVIQSKIAIGSGGLLGKGFMGGTQSQLKFLPEGHTDFIFSVYSEEWGFAGIVFLFFLFFLLILWGIDVAMKAKDVLGSLLAAGIVGLISFYFLINVSMTLGVMPVVGIPLPLMSYGGTSMVTTLAMLGLVVNVKIRRFKLFY